MGNRFQIIVSEPWDFKGLDGQNLINGSITKIIFEEYLIFKSDNNLTFENIEGQILLLHPRNFKENLSNLNSAIGINGGLITNYEEQLPIEDLRSNSIFVIIGSLSPLDPAR